MKSAAGIPAAGAFENFDLTYTEIHKIENLANLSKIPLKLPKIPQNVRKSLKIPQSLFIPDRPEKSPEKR
jgi:hypothetical protein